MMGSEEELLGLMATYDGESAESERGEMEAALNQNPAMRETLAAFAKLQAAAQSEPVPDVSPKTAPPDALWPLIAERQIALPDDAAQRLREFAASERAPEIAPARFNEIWPHIALRMKTLHDVAPKIDTQQWHGVWKHISARTSPVKSEPAASAPAWKQVAAADAPRTNANRPHSFSTWLWAAGMGVAASILLALVLHASLPAIPKVNWGAGATNMSLSIPEAQDEHYGVRVRFVPGNSDPVVTLYYKNPPEDKTKSSGTEEPQK